MIEKKSVIDVQGSVEQESQKKNCSTDTCSRRSM